MMVDFTLRSLAAKAAVMLLAVCACGALIFAVISEFIVGTLTDERAAASLTALEAATDYFPNSARLHGRLAAIAEREGDLSLAESHILRAIARSPYNYNFAAMLASVEESRSDCDSAERSLREAIRLAPNKADVHWSLANLLLRRGELGPSLEEFQTAAALKRSLLPGTLNLIWRASNGSVEALEIVSGEEAAARIALARFLLNHSRAEEAAAALNTIGREQRLASAECAALLSDFVRSNQLELARSLWARTVGANDREPRLISNGGFESDAVEGFSQFDWKINRSDYARASIAEGNARTGARSLRLDFLGRDTTRLDNEVEQLVVVKPGAHYRLECYWKSDGLVTSEGPRIVVTTTPAASPEWVASTEPVAAGRSDWQHLETEFVAPSSLDGRPLGLYISIKRRPKFSYDEPTRGRIYFDDFTLTEQPPVATERQTAKGHDRS
jgi:tetratricopeptide (TPR) repeat protein